MVKIHIFGGPGSGKTTLADSLSKKLNMPHFDLDNFRYKNEDIDYTLFEDEIKRDELLKKALSKKNWVSEGAYTNFALPCFEKSDVIIILEPIKLITDYRIIKRLLLHKLGIQKRHKLELWRNLPQLLEWNREFTFNKLPLLKEKIKHLENKIIHMRSSGFDLDDLLVKINNLKNKNKEL